MQLHYGNEMYNKLFTKILDSSIWLENQPTRLVWITFLACMDQDGVVALSGIGNVANRARVSEKEAERAIQCLESPDAHNPDQDQEGRRIERIPGVGWQVLNAAKYREIIKASEARAANRERVRRYRAKKVGNDDVMNGNDLVMQSDQSKASTEEDKREETASPSKRKKGTRIPDVFTVTDAMRSWFIEKGFTFPEPPETEKFINYWTAASGRNAVKLDWAATWRTWMLNAQDYKGGFPTIKKPTLEELDRQKGIEICRQAREMSYVPRDS